MTRAVRYAVVVLVVAAMSSVAGAQQEKPRDEWLDQPVDDATFEGFSSRFTYDRELALDVETLERHHEDGVVYGSSRGAVAATIASAADERIAAVVLHYGGHFDALERDHLAAACPANYIGRFSPRPLLMLNGTFDADFDKVASVDPIFDMAGEPKTIRWTEGGHGRASEKNLEAMHAWVREALK